MPNSDAMSTLKTMAQEAINRAGGVDNNSLLTTVNLQASNVSLASTLSDKRIQLFSNDTNMQTNGPHNTSNHTGNSINANSLLKPVMMQTGMNEAHIPPLLGVAPLGPSPLKKEHQLQFQMMEAAEYHLPHPIDSERVRSFMHRQPVQTPASYPQVHFSSSFWPTITVVLKWDLIVS